MPALALVVALATVPHQTLTRLLDGLLIRRSLVVMLLLFGLLGLSLIWTDGQNLDAAVFLRINVHGPHPRYLDRAMGLATQLGNVTAAAVLAALAFLAGNRRLAVEIVLGVISLWLIVETIKALADRTRPYRVFAQTRIVGWWAIGPSFPSGHTLQAFFLASHSQAAAISPPRAGKKIGIAHQRGIDSTRLNQPRFCPRKPMPNRSPPNLVKLSHGPAKRFAVAVYDRSPGSGNPANTNPNPGSSTNSGQ